jgi:hypothetical protein
MTSMTNTRAPNDETKSCESWHGKMHGSIKSLSCNKLPFKNHIEPPLKSTFHRFIVSLSNECINEASIPCGMIPITTPDAFDTHPLSSLHFFFVFCCVFVTLSLTVTVDSVRVHITWNLALSFQRKAPITCVPFSWKWHPSH